MDHLPMPTNPVGPALEVPFFGILYDPDSCTHQPDGPLCDDCTASGFQGWEIFPERMGMETNPGRSWLSNADLWLESKAEPDLWLHEALLQAWLWFGVLHVFFEGFKRVDTSLFLLRTDAGAERLDTSRLRTLLV